MARPVLRSSKFYSGNAILTAGGYFMLLTENRNKVIQAFDKHLHVTIDGRPNFLIDESQTQWWLSQSERYFVLTFTLDFFDPGPSIFDALTLTGGQLLTGVHEKSYKKIKFFLDPNGPAVSNINLEYDASVAINSVFGDLLPAFTYTKTLII